MVLREVEQVLRAMAAQFKAIAITGPRQSGKTTLPRSVFPDKPSGLEVDVLVDNAARLRPVEIRSGATLSADGWRGLKAWLALAGDNAISLTLVYGGETAWNTDTGSVVPWRQIPELAGSI